MKTTTTSVILWTEEDWCAVFEDNELVTQGSLDLETLYKLYPGGEFVELSPTFYRRHIKECGGAPLTLDEFPLEDCW